MLRISFKSKILKCELFLNVILAQILIKFRAYLFLFVFLMKSWGKEIY
jgi:hypothetical protein